MKVSKSFLYYLFIIILFFSIVLIRRIDVITNPQFYAEDGTFWYSEAYENNNVLKPFFTTKQRYFQTISRIGALISTNFDLKHAPLILNIIAILIETAPAIFILSNRFKKLIPNINKRIIIGLIYLSLPNTFETHANITNSHWKLALLIFLIIITINKSKIWKIFDFIIIFIGGLSGPFILFIFPLTLIYFYIKKTITIHKYYLLVLGITFFTQCISLLFITTNSIRSTAPLGISLFSFIKIVSGNIFVSGLLSLNLYNSISLFPFWKNNILPIIFIVIFSIILLYTFIKASLEIKFFIILSMLLFTASLISPMVSLDKPQWDVMTLPGAGNRYYFFPIMAMVFSLIYIIEKSNNFILKNISLFLFFIFIFIGISNDFIMKPYPDLMFEHQIQKFNDIPSGTDFLFKIPPDGWTMKLTKK